MNILLLTPSMNVESGGPPRVVAGSAVALARRGHSVEIVSLVEGEQSLDAACASFPELGHNNVKLDLFPRSSPKLLGMSRPMLSSLRRRMHSYDVMHVHGVWELCLAEAAAEARLSGIPVFVSAHGMLDQWSMRQSKLKKYFALQLQTGAMLRHADAIVYGTEDELEECRHVVPSSSGAVVPNGIDTGELSQNSLPHLPDLKVHFPQISEWKRTILFFSRVHPKKGLDLLLDAFMANAPMFPGVGLLIAGIAQDRAFETELRKRIADSPMTDRIAFTTELFGPAARVVFRNTDIFALPSHQEGFSIAILEAMALEKPVLITDRCHLPEVASKWGCGLVATDDQAGISEALCGLLRLPDEELRAMGARGRQAVIDNFSWDAVAKKLEHLYENRC